MINQVRLSELVALKLSHDLAGPIGALSNGIELLEDGNSDYFKDSFDLVKTTSKEAVSKLLFYRKAYSISGKDISESTTELFELTSNLINQKKINLLYDKNQKGLEINSRLFKVILNVIILFEKYLITGGRLEINFINDKKAEVIAHGDKLKIQEKHINIMNYYIDEMNVDAAEVNAYLIYCLSKELDAKSNIEINDNKIKYSIELS